VAKKVEVEKSPQCPIKHFLQGLIQEGVKSQRAPTPLLNKVGISPTGFEKIILEEDDE